jgi:hypothetical protein
VVPTVGSHENLPKVQSLIVDILDHYLAVSASQSRDGWCSRFVIALTWSTMQILRKSTIAVKRRLFPKNGSGSP